MSDDQCNSQDMVRVLGTVGHTVVFAMYRWDRGFGKSLYRFQCRSLENGVCDHMCGHNIFAFLYDANKRQLITSSIIGIRQEDLGGQWIKQKPTVAVSRTSV